MSRATSGLSHLFRELGDALFQFSNLASIISGLRGFLITLTRLLSLGAVGADLFERLDRCVPEVRSAEDAVPDGRTSDTGDSEGSEPVPRPAFQS